MGDANEMIVAGILTRWGFEVGMLNAKGGAYDLWLMAYKRPVKEGERPVLKPLRVQVKSISPSNSIRLEGGGRGGSDRAYTSTEKKLVDKRYKYTIEHNDMIIGVDSKTLDLYLVPTRLTATWGKSKSISKLGILKNNYGILLNWNKEFLKKLANKIPDTTLAKQPTDIQIKLEDYQERD